jgi:hypothetical protein
VRDQIFRLDCRARAARSNRRHGIYCGSVGPNPAAVDPRKTLLVRCAQRVSVYSIGRGQVPVSFIALNLRSLTRCGRHPGRARS